MIVAFPSFTPVTVPFCTLAIASSDDFHVIFLFVAFDGKTLAVKVTVFPISISSLVLFNVTPVTFTVSSCSGTSAV